jgi:hypothetical protein
VADLGSKVLSPGEKRKPPNAGKGRVKGVPNKATREFRETVRQLLDDNRDNVGRWLSLVAEGDGSEHGKPDPGKALDLLAKLAEFAAPKLGRTEVVGEGGGPIQYQRVVREIVDPAA